MSNDNREKVTIEKATEGLTKLFKSLQNSDVIKDQEKPPAIKEKPRETETMDRYESLKKDIENGRVKNYYINKEGDIIQKVTVHLPIDMVTRLKKEAIDQRVTLSELIRKRLK